MLRTARDLGWRWRPKLAVGRQFRGSEPCWRTHPWWCMSHRHFRRRRTSMQCCATDASDVVETLRHRQAQANSAFHPSGVGKWVPASAGKAKAGMVHFVSGWTRGVQVKLWNPLRTSAIPERLRGVFTTRRYTNARLHYITLQLGSTVNEQI